MFAMGIVFSPNVIESSPLEHKDLHQDSVQRFVSIYSLVASLEDADVQDRLMESTQGENRKLSPNVVRELQIALLQRLTNINPSEALEFALEREEKTRSTLIRTVFDVWATTDIEEVIRHAKQLDSGVASLALESIVCAQRELPLANLLEITFSLKLDTRSGIRIYSDNVNAETVSDPKTAWFELATLSTERKYWSETRGLLGRLAIQWFKADGFAALDEIRTAFPRGDETRESVETVLSSVARENPEAALEYLTSLSRREYILEDVVMKIWAEKDVQAALEATFNISSNKLREDLQRDVAGEWGKQEPRFLLKNLEVLPEPVRYVAVRTATATIAESSLQEAGEYALQIEDSVLKETAVSWLLPLWSEREPHTLLDWLLEDTANAPLIAKLRTQIVYSVLDDDPRRAFQLAREHPIEDWEPGMEGQLQQLLLDVPFNTSGVGLEAEIMDNIARSDPIIARQLLSGVREGKTKLVATLHVGDALRYRGEIDEAFDLADQLPEPDRDKYRWGVIVKWINGDPIGLVDALSEVPSATLQSTTAMQLLRWNRRNDTLTDSQVGKLQEYLNEDDRQSLEYQ